MASCLVLVPTEVEKQHLPSHLLQGLGRVGATVEICGFGPVVAAARTASLIASHRPQHVVLCGVAGAMCETLRVGQAYPFESVACYGVGVGCGPTFATASSVGWRQWAGGGDQPALQYPIEDVINLNEMGAAEAPPAPRLLLTVCAASQSSADVMLKLKAFPAAVAEDMEGFAVAAACQLAGVPLTIVRGISNRAGDRMIQNWKIADAMVAAAALVEEWVGL